VISLTERGQPASFNTKNAAFLKLSKVFTQINKKIKFTSLTKIYKEFGIRDYVMKESTKLKLKKCVR
jgi:hypothetical protein